MFNFSTLKLHSHPCITVLILAQETLCVPAERIINLCHRMRHPGSYDKSDVHHITHVFIARVRSEIISKCTQNSVSLTQQVQKKLFCLGISGFKLSKESYSPLPISLTVLHVACCAEKKGTHFFTFITSFPFFTSFFQHAHNKYILSYGCSFSKVHNKRTFFSPAVGNTAPFT